MDYKPYKAVRGSYLLTNLRYAAIGAVVGIIICTIKSVFAGKLLDLPTALLNVMFSMIITLCIANSLILSECLWRPQKIKIWQFILVYYGCNLLGMLIGIEISYLIISLIFHGHYVFMGHYDEYRFSYIIVLIVGTIIYFYQAQRNSLQARIAEKELDVARLTQLKTQAELQTLQSKINPHFLYNALNSIASLIHEDADRAEDMTLKLSKFFRYSINSQQSNLTSVREEMDMVNTYLDIEKVRFGDRISFNSEISAVVSDASIPRFLIQPLVETALKHGLSNKAGNGQLNIVIEGSKDNLIICVADNGQPFPDELNMGYGLQSTYDKLTLLYGDNYRIQITNQPLKQIKITLPQAL